MKVLVVGGGGREHAIAWKLSQSPKITELFCAPGNAGTASFATNVEVGAEDIGVLALWAVEHEIDLTVVGPEAPLAAGIVDVFVSHGLKIFGPNKEAAQLESSKAFAKDVMIKAGVPTPEGQEFSDYEQAKAYLEEKGAPIVIKADGLAAGKGVVVAQTMDDAQEALRSLMVDGALSGAGKTVVIEECLVGKEASVMALIEGDTVLPLVVSQDYKRLLDNDEGPNTGGMGAVSPTPALGDVSVEQLMDDIFVPVVHEMHKRGIQFTGFLYAGVMVDETAGIKVLEFNCRLGDPETQVLLVRLESDLLDALYRAATNRLGTVELRWSSRAAACVVASSKGYPGEVDDNKPIEGLFEPTDNHMVFLAGANIDEASGKVHSQGGRVLCVSGLGSNIREALDQAYEGMKKISFEGMHYRKDIGSSSL
jgi:phosphoribosylamine--glycine ligase